MIHIASDKSNSFLHKIDQKSICPNAIDLRLAKVFMISHDPFTLTEEDRIHRTQFELAPDNDGYFNLWDGSYGIVFDNTISVASDEAGFVISRSTLMRNGVYIHSGLYDSGYTGPMHAALHVTRGLFKTKPNTRLAQFLLFKAESLKLYDGGYGYDSSGNRKKEQQKMNY